MYLILHSVSLVFNRFGDFWQRYKRKKIAVVGLLIFGIFVFAALLAESISPYDPQKMGMDLLHPPYLDHLMGTDDLGRDVFSQVVFGARVSLLVGFLASILSALIGVLIGTISGFFGGLVDDLLMRITEIFQIIPRFFLALLFVALFGTNLWNIVFVIGILGWPTVARLVRVQYLSMKESLFVEAAKALGESSPRIVFSEILPNVLPPVIVVASLQVAHAILLEAGLGFLGLSDPTEFSWGRTLNNSIPFIRSGWWMAIFPGLAIFFLVLSLNLVGDGLNDVFNPRLKER